MEKSQTPAVILVIALGLIAIIILSVVVIRGIRGYGNALKRFEEPEGEWPGGKQITPGKRYQDVPPEMPPTPQRAPAGQPSTPGLASPGR